MGGISRLARHRSIFWNTCSAPWQIDSVDDPPGWFRGVKRDLPSRPSRSAGIQKAAPYLRAVGCSCELHGPGVDRLEYIHGPWGISPGRWSPAIPVRWRMGSWAIRSVGRNSSISPTTFGNWAKSRASRAFCRLYGVTSGALKNLGTPTANRPAPRCGLAALVGWLGGWGIEFHSAGRCSAKSPFTLGGNPPQWAIAR